MASSFVRPLPARLVQGSEQWTNGSGKQQLSGRGAVLSYVQALADDNPDYRLALYVTEDLMLLAPFAVSPDAGGSMPTEELISQGRQLGAAGFLLVERGKHSARIVDDDFLSELSRLRSTSRELGVPLLDYLMVAGTEIESVGGIRGSRQ